MAEGIAVAEIKINELIDLLKSCSKNLKDLQEENRVRSSFFDSVSHEMRTPISNIKMAITMLSVSLDSSENAKVKDYMQILDHECQRELELINDFLDLQRSESPGNSLVLDDIEVAPWLIKLSKSFLDRFKSRQQIFEIARYSDLPIIQSHQESLTRIVIELLNNACKYTPAGGSIQVFAGIEHDCFFLQVFNSGVEIGEGDLPHIFERFYRSKIKNLQGTEGSGLGLALVQQLAFKLGGEILVKSSDLKTQFTVVIPLRGKD